VRGEHRTDREATERRADLSSYSGRVAFPGGKRDAGDADLRRTALRETWEEVGIEPDRIEVFAELECFRTGLGHVVKPFAGRVDPAAPIAPNPAEVARLIWVPCSAFESDPFAVRGRYRGAGGRSIEIYTWRFDGAEIWGLTASILRRYFLGKR